MANEERTYFVLGEDNCRFESMTKEQILEAIAEATGETPVHIDDAFITKIKEMNNNSALKWWVGTESEYNALSEKDSGTLYIITDTSEYGDLERLIESLQDSLSGLYTAFGGLDSEVGNLQGAVNSMNDEIDEAQSSIASIETKTNKLGTMLIDKTGGSISPSDVIHGLGNYKLLVGEYISGNETQRVLLTVDSLDDSVWGHVYSLKGHNESGLIGEATHTVDMYEYTVETENDEVIFVNCNRHVNNAFTQLSLTRLYGVL